MVLVLAVLVPAFIVVLWAFFKYSPRAEEHDSVVMFNTISIILALAGAGGYTFYVYVTMSRGPDAHWWPYVAGVFSITGVALVLGISAFVRRMIYSSRKPQSPERTPTD
jgi:hypothetical protein